MREIHLICNAHLDPMWLWEWEEGAAETLSTYRTAARLCEEFDGFVFCHNEALLYEWIEEYEPSLFEKIRTLVAAGKWNIMGGWYLQPDCNMPSGEGFLRQIGKGNEYFKEKFGVSFDTAVNFDSFGHNRGLVQIMAKCGYKNYILHRPNRGFRDYPQEYIWEGFDGSEVMVNHHYRGYNSPLGKSAELISQLVETRSEAPLCILWGVGNHGGGPSRKDLTDIRALKEELAAKDIKLIHSTPEQYFAAARKARPVQTLPRMLTSLNPSQPGCYTSQSEIKRLYRKLEKELFLTEKVASAACAKGLMKWPEEISQAERDLCFMQFHDILPGSSIKRVEEAGIRVAYHGLEILSRLRTRAYFALSSEVGYTPDGSYPILVYNPLPYDVERIVEVEFNLADQNWGDDVTFMTIEDKEGNSYPIQIEHEYSNIPLDWRKHLTFRVPLKASSMNVFCAKPYRVPQKLVPLPMNGVMRFACGELKVDVDSSKGLITRIEKNGKVYLDGEGMKITLFTDTEDAWAQRMFQHEKIGDKMGEFKLLSAEEGSVLSGVHTTLPSCRIIEDGDVRTVVEAVFGYGLSRAVVRYTFPKTESRFSVSYTVMCAEKDKCLKIELPTGDGDFIGQKAFGREALSKEGCEDVFNDWCGIFHGKEGLFAVTGGTYAASFTNNCLYLNLLRTAAYTGHPIYDRPLVPQDRYTDRFDLGERSFTFTFAVDTCEEADKIAMMERDVPISFSFFPKNTADIPLESKPFITISDDKVQLSAMFRRKEGKYLVRLYNASENETEATLEIPAFGIRQTLTFTPFVFRTFEAEQGEWREIEASAR